MPICWMENELISSQLLKTESGDVPEHGLGLDLGPHRPAGAGAIPMTEPPATSRMCPSEATSPRRKTARTVTLSRVLGVGAFVGLAAINLYGLSYYIAPAAGRVRHPLHAWLKPSGYIGQSLGFVALAAFLFLWLYPIRKRYANALAPTGSVGSWLDVHVVAGLLVPLIAATHASWRFSGLIGLGYLSLFVVFLSGVVGRYLYSHVPRSRNGLELTLEDAIGERKALLYEIAKAGGLPMTVLEKILDPGGMPTLSSNPLRVIARMVGDDLTRRRRVRALRRVLLAARPDGPALDAATLRGLLRLVRREIALGQQVRMLDGIHRVFRYWHAAHKPFALTALGAVLLHVAVVIAVGSTWLW
jgi:hypothetical protein